MSKHKKPVSAEPSGRGRNFTGREIRERSSSISFRKICSRCMIRKDGRDMESGTSDQNISVIRL